MLLLADEVDLLTGVVDRLFRKASRRRLPGRTGRARRRSGRIRDFGVGQKLGGGGSVLPSATVNPSFAVFGADTMSSGVLLALASVMLSPISTA